tara:strand:+ start:574 stop:957 length:384 start_codon:yes stop_codon:yes gene_type:complete
MKAFEKDAERFHEEIQEMQASDKNTQKELRETFTQNPDGLRRRLEDIEAKSLGLKFDENNTLVNITTGNAATEREHELHQKNTDEAMLTSNHELFTEYQMQYKNGVIISVDWKKLKKNEKEALTRGS